MELRRFAANIVDTVGRHDRESLVTEVMRSTFHEGNIEACAGVAQPKTNTAPHGCSAVRSGPPPMLIG
jgi:hypothetical protein